MSGVRSGGVCTFREAGLGLGIYLLLIELMLLNQQDATALGTQPSYSVSGATHVGREETEFTTGYFASALNGSSRGNTGGSRRRVSGCGASIKRRLPFHRRAGRIRCAFRWRVCIPRNRSRPC